MMKTLHDKVAYSNPYKAIIFKCDEALNALAIKNDFSHLVVAGRSVFKVLSIKEDCFVETLNLRVGKSKTINLSYSAADVAWHPHQDNVLASAALNGYVVIWDINSHAKSRQTMTFQEHKRAVNRVIFHHSRPYQLLSASQDGMVMIHDIRSQTVCAKFGWPGGDSVRDAQFSGDFMFAAALDNNVQIWDTRYPNKYERQFPAHNGPVFSLDWHPSDKRYLATAGRDKMIKVWDMSPDLVTPECEYNIMNIAPVARVKWRPQRKHHLASCCLQIDNSVNVWDLGRPYIPFATFEGHTDSATCIEWREDCHTFFTCGKDCNVIQHIFTDAKRPADKVNLASIDFSIGGNIGFSFSDKNDSTGRSKKISQNRRQFTVASSSFHYFQSCNDTVMPEIQKEELPSPDIPSTWQKRFVALAQNYRLSGASVVDLCYYNGQIAEKYDRPEVAQSWRILASFYSPSLACQSGPSHISRSSNLSHPQKHQDLKEMDIKPALKRQREKTKNKGLIHIEPTSGSNEESSEVEGDNSEVDKSITQEFNMNTSILFGEGEMDDSSFEWCVATGTLEDNTDDLNLGNIPVEGFRIRHELDMKSGLGLPAMELGDADRRHHSLIENRIIIRNARDGSGCDTDRRHSLLVDHHISSQIIKDPSEYVEPTLIIKDIESPEPLDFSDVVADMIKCYGEEGDVQTVVTMLIVLGDFIQHHLDVAYQESWVFAYLDLLGQFRQWTVSNSIIKQSKLMGVNILNQESTTYHTSCAKCTRPLERVSWLCDRCKSVTNLCSICHNPVKGLMVWCQGCLHGGHIEHIKEWLSSSNMCPAGCGHQCEYA